jgi:hypothetical protein
MVPGYSLGIVHDDGAGSEFPICAPEYNQCATRAGQHLRRRGRRRLLRDRWNMPSYLQRDHGCLQLYMQQSCKTGFHRHLPVRGTSFLIQSLLFIDSKPFLNLFHLSPLRCMYSAWRLPSTRINEMLWQTNIQRGGAITRPITNSERRHSMGCSAIIRPGSFPTETLKTTKIVCIFGRQKGVHVGGQFSESFPVSSYETDCPPQLGSNYLTGSAPICDPSTANNITVSTYRSSKALLEGV